jgi:methionyl-tRNA formyltransferase
VRVLFAGTPEIAVPSLDALAGSPHEIVGVLTAVDRPTGRGRRTAAGPVKERAVSLGLPILQPDRLGSEIRRAVGELKPDLLVCVAYGRIFGPKFLSLFELGGINLHPSLLPKYRGPAPIPAAILGGDTQTGVTIQALALEMDAGDILAQKSVMLSGTETTETLTTHLSGIGAQMLVGVVQSLADGTVTSRPQNAADATSTGLISKADGEIDWTSPADVIERSVRAFYPWPLAFTTFKGQRLNILESTSISVGDESPETAPDGGPGTVVRVDTERGILVETGNGKLALTRLQLQSRKALSFTSFQNGVHDFVGAVLGG